MHASAFVLHIEPRIDFPAELVEQLSPKLATLVHRSVNDAGSLADALNEHQWSAILCSKNELNDANTPHSFLDSLPGMACQIHLDENGDLDFPYTSQGCMDLLGIPAAILEQHPQQLLIRLHPDDTESFYNGMRQSVAHSTPWNWEGRIVLPDNKEIKWLNLRAKPPVTDIQGTTWNGFMFNITQNKQAGIEVKLSRQRLRELSSHIESIKEDERMRIAREIHDEIGVLLTALKMDLSWLSQRLPADNPAIQEKVQEWLGCWTLRENQPTT